MTTISTRSLVQAEGSLLTPPSAGAPTNEVLDSCLTSAQRNMLKRFKAAEYIEVRDYAGSDPDMIEKRDIFSHAESCFALAHLPTLLTNAQLVKTGLVRTKKVGESEQTFASGKETEQIRGTWIAAAIEWLSPYLANKVLNAAGDEIGWRSKDKKMTIVAM